MNYKNILHEINIKQMETFCPLDIFLKDGTKRLPKHKRGLYWIWTRLENHQLKDVKDNHIAEVPISKLIEQRSNLNYVCNIEIQNFRIVYNGIGGYKSNSKSFGLRERILQEINSKDYRTGSLNLINRNYNSEDWAVSFFDFDDANNKLTLDFLNLEDAYINNASTLEKLWRLEFGHPILCRY